MSPTEGCVGIKLPTVSILYCCLTNCHSLNGPEQQLFVTARGLVARLGSAGQFSWCLLCSCRHMWLGWSRLKAQLGWASKMASSLMYLVPQLGWL